MTFYWRLFVQQPVRANNKYIIKALNVWAFVRRIRSWLRWCWWLPILIYMYFSICIEIMLFHVWFTVDTAIFTHNGVVFCLTRQWPRNKWLSTSLKHMFEQWVELHVCCLIRRRPDEHMKRCPYIIQVCSIDQFIQWQKRKEVLNSLKLGNFNGLCYNQLKSSNDLSPIRGQIVIWCNNDLLPIRIIRTEFHLIRITVLNFLSSKYILEHRL